MSDATGERDEAVAIIGMAGRFPGAGDPDRLWRNLRAGVESIRFFTPAELAAAGVDPALAADPAYVPARGVLADVATWDASFFGFSPREAEILDPQQRLFLECTWEALEDAGYDSARFAGRIGVYAGATASTYWSHNLRGAADPRDPTGGFQALISNDKDYLPTRVSFVLDLRGPSVGVQTACSSSLVAVHQACQSLLDRECDMALAGGASIQLPTPAGYLYQPDGIMSADGRHRSFDAAARGSVFGDGVAAVLLKRLDDALADGDPIYAVVRGSAVNNDGAAKVGFTAPSVDAQAEVVAEALAVAGVEPATITYLEAHGSATPLGDPIEVAALTRAFRAGGERRGWCALGSVKANVGHLYTASGVTALIKTVQALRHREIPPALHFTTPNPAIDLAASPFFVPRELRPWPAAPGVPRRAGVNSLGIGGTNAHVVLEEAPPPADEAAGSGDAGRPWQILPLAARTDSALAAASANLAVWLRQQSGGAASFADAAWTLQIGRRAWHHRRVVFARGAEAAAAALADLDPARVLTQVREAGNRPVAFLLSGIGDQYPGMGRGLYQSEPAFREAVDRCAELLAPRLGRDLRDLLYPGGTPAAPDLAAGEEMAADAAGAGAAPDLRQLLRRGASTEAGGPLADTAVAQPALFVVQYALARLWMEWGVRPQALLGHSLGEYVAACLAGVLSLEDALTLVAERARLIAALPGGAMLAVPLGEAAARELLGGGLALAVVNGPASSVFAGPADEIAALAEALAARGVASSRPGAGHPFHSALLQPVAAPLTRLAASLTLRPPRIPYLSNLTGSWITAEQATDPGYWARHMLGTVQFAAGLAELLDDPARIFLEIGPGLGLGSFVRQHPRCAAGQLVLPSLRHAAVREADAPFLLRSLGKLWLAGVDIDWAGYHRHERRRRVRLPTYPFERRRYWLDRSREAADGAAARVAAPPPRGHKAGLPADWLYRPAWRERPVAGEPAVAASGERQGWLLLAAGGAAGEPLAPLPAALAAHLRGAGQAVATVAAGGDGFAVLGPGRYRLRPGAEDDWRELLAELRASGRMPAHVVHLWGAAGGDTDASLELGFYALLALGKAVAAAGAAPLRLTVVADGLQPVAAGETTVPEKALMLGLCSVLPQEIAGFSCHACDLPAGAPLDGLLAVLAAADLAPLAAWRDGRLLERVYLPVAAPGGESKLKRHGVYLITGGLGGAGLILARHLAATAAARLVLVGRTPLPARDGWRACRDEHGAAHPVVQRLAAVEELEGLGAAVVVEAADVADAGALAGIVARCVERFGTLDGVVHAAGLPGPAGLAPLGEVSRALCEAHFRAKVHGTRALAAALAGRQLDFCLLMSSLSTVVGGALLGPYAAANHFLDTFAAHRAALGEPWLSVAWDRWPAPGLPSSPYEMTAAEAVAVCERALAVDGEARLVVSTGPLPERIAESAPPAPVVASPAPVVAPAAAVAAGESHARPRRAHAPASSELERLIAAAWQEALGIEQVGVDDNFFDLGGNSLLAAQMLAILRRGLGGLDVPAVALFEAPTVGALARLVAPRLAELGGAALAAAAPTVPAAAAARAAAAPAAGAHGGGGEVAIVGMAGRFPGAASVEELWRNLCEGREAVTYFSDEELLAAGVDRAELGRPGYVKARPFLAGAAGFDARLFGYSPRDAALTDPQQRVFLEVAWEALDDAGYDPRQTAVPIGLFAGVSFSTYLLRLYRDPELAATLDPFQMMIGNDKDSLPTVASYKLDLTGPSIAVQTHCSTSLVAVHLACQSLLAGECELALAGGVSIQVPQRHGYRYQAGGQESQDGHTRPFDARATGTVFGDGAGIVVLKPLGRALADGDRVYAVIKGSAVNNDGSLKAGYTAPSVEGQARSAALALERAGVDAASLGYVEAHGSATPLGDPIEVAALTRAFRAHTTRRGFCGLGSVKGNLGHLDRAAGVTGLIKTALAVRDGVLPASLHFERPNPELDLAAGPFYVVAERTPWPPAAGPRRAAVASLGMGGTNAHVVLEEAPPPLPSGPSRPWQLLTVSAHTATALDAAAAALARTLAGPTAAAAADEAALAHTPADPTASVAADAAARRLADAAFTLKLGRRALGHRRAVLCRGGAEAAAALAAGDPRWVFSAEPARGRRRVAFLLPGLGDHYPGMAAGLYRGEPTFRRHLDRCAAILSPLLGAELLDLLYPAGAGDGLGGDEVGGAASGVDLRQMLGRGAGAASGLDRTLVAQPATFAVEYALAQLWMEWGVVPDVLLGYSLGEYVAACLAGVLSLEDALLLVAGRARLLEALPAGAMLAVPLAPEALAAHLDGELALAAVNGPGVSVVAGPVAAVAALESALAASGLATRRLATAHAFHSKAMAPAVAPFRELLASVRLAPPRLPYVSNVTGGWITAAEATDPEYYVRHLLGTVRFGDGLALLLADPERLLLEVGPGQSLSSFARQHPACDERRAGAVHASLRSAFERRDDQALLLATLGRLWAAGAAVDWAGFYAHERRRRVALPSYPFERQEYWLEAHPAGAASTAAGAPLGALVKQPEVGDWFYLPGWRQAPPAAAAAAADADESGAPWLLLHDGGGLAELLTARLAAAGRQTVRAVAGRELGRRADGVWTLDPRRRDQVLSLLAQLRAAGDAPARVVHLGAADPRPPADAAEALDLGFYSLLALVQALKDSGLRDCRIDVVTSGVHQVSGEEPLVPERAAVLGVVKVAPQELPHLALRQIDLAPGAPWDEAAVARLAVELGAAGAPPIVALRGGLRWFPSYDRIPGGAAAALPWRERGVYLITGGLGGLGLGLARCLAAAWRARLVLVGRTPLAAGAGRAAAVGELERLGAEVMVATADVTDRAAMAAVVERAVERFGALNGVLHAAGVPGAGLIELKSRAAAAAVLAPKVAGARVLDEVLRPLELDFLVLFSSVTAVLGGPGQVDYCAANAVLGSFARARQAAGRRTVAIDWSEWQWDAWQEGLLGFAPEIRALFEDNRRRLGIAFDEGALALGRAVASGLAHVVVSAADLPALGRFAASLSQPDAAAALRGTGGPRATHARPALRSAWVAPRGPLEETLAAMWRDLLGLDAVGVEDDFFELGGHSLLATQLFARLRDALAVELPLAAIFEAPTVAGLAARLAAGGDGVAGVDAAPPPPIPRLARQAPLPLSIAQERFWLLDQIESDRAVYNENGVFELAGAIDVAALRRTVDAVVARHETLRTSFHLAGERPAATVHAAAPLALPLLDLSALPPAARRRQALAVAAAEGRRPFDLGAGPLFTAHLVRLARREHWLLVRTHHLVWDGESAQLAAREIAAGYPAAAAGDASPLAPLPITYLDYAAWQRASQDEAALAPRLAWWRERLAGAPPQLELPADRPRPAERSLRGAARTRPLSPALWEAVRALAQSSGATPFMVLAATLQAFLARATGAADVAVGTPVSGRDLAATEGLVGLFINTVVLREPRALEGDFASLLARARQSVLLAHQHQVPFERLVQELAPERGGQAQRQPFFQVLLSLQDPPPVPPFAGLTLRLRELPVEVTKFDLTLVVTQQHGAVSATLEYLADLFDGATAERLLAQLLHLLESAAGAPSLPVAELPLLSAAERRQVTAEWAAGDERPRPAGRRLEEEFEECARQAPDAIVATCESHWLSYRELDRRAELWAGRLAAHGVGCDSYVGLLAEPGLAMLVAVVAVLKAGGAYVPLSLKLPPAERTQLLAETAARVLLVGASLRTELGGFAGTVLVLEEPLPAAPPARPRPRPWRGGELADRHPAYVIFTSGSTGRSKGVIVEHRQVLSHVQSIRERLPFAPGMRYALIHPLAVDGSKTLLFAALGGGGCLHVIGLERTTDGRALADYFAAHQIEVLKIAPSHLAALHRMTEPARLMPRRWLMVGGEASRSDWVAELLRLAPHCTVCNHYGPTETAVGVVTELLHAGDTPTPAPQVPLGRPLANVRVHVLDRHQQPVPAGVAGELYIGGRSVARGYLGRPVTTAEAFRPDPFADAPGARLYRAGDLVRWRADGRLDFLGRTDFQVKIRGYRVELRAVESQLAQHPAVSDVAVTGRPDARGELRLVAYVVPAAGAAILPHELRAFLLARLPEYMVPALYETLAALPRQAQGKLDVRALPEPAAPRAATAPARPRTALEAQVAAVWCEVLGLAEIGLDDDFFALGGHSFLAMQLVSRLRQALGFEVAIRDLFTAPTVAGLAAAIASQHGQQTPRLAAVADRPAELPLSFLQERYWFIVHLGETRTLSARGYRLEGELDLGALERALNAIVARQAALRSVFHAVDDRPMQRVLPAARLTLRRYDLAALPARQRQAAYDDWGRQFRRCDLPLDRPPLLAAAVLQLAPREHCLILMAHHIVFDALSWAILFAELDALYGAFSRGLPAPLLPALPVDYADFVVWQRQRFAGEALRAEVAFWKGRLAGAAPLYDRLADLPASPPGRRAANHPLRLAPAVAEPLKQLGARHAATPFMTFLAVYEALLYCTTGCSDLSLATYSTGRNRLEIEGLVGLFAGLVALRLRCDGALPFTAVLAAAREVAVEAFARQQDMPLQKLTSELYPAVDLRPITQVMFSYRPAADPRFTLSLPGVEVTVLARDDIQGAGDFSLALMESDDGVRGHFLLGGRFLPATGERLARRFELLAAEAAARPEAPLDELWAAVLAVESTRRDRQLEELQAASRERLRRSARRSAGGSPVGQAPG